VKPIEFGLSHGRNSIAKSIEGGAAPKTSGCERPTSSAPRFPPNLARVQKIKRAPSCMIRMFELKPAGPVIVPAVPSLNAPPLP
jgi:hypothetical protein